MDNALVDELFAPDYVNHMMPGGREGFKQFFPMLRSAYPDLKMHNRIEHLIAEGDYVVARVTFHFTNAGKEATVSDLTEFRLANGKIVEDWPPRRLGSSDATDRGDSSIRVRREVGIQLEIQKEPLHNGHGS